jgi:hypothetical protein
MQTAPWVPFAFRLSGMWEMPASVEANPAAVGIFERAC